MSARGQTSRNARTAATGGPAPVVVWSAIALSAVAALLRITGPLLPVVRPAHDAGFTAWPLLAALALLPVTVAAVLAWLGRPEVAAAVLTVLAFFAPGELLVQLQLAVDVSRASLPWLVMPTSLAPLHPGPGLWLVVGAQLATVAAGVMVLPWWRGAGSAAIAEGNGQSLQPGEPGLAEGTGRQARVTVALCVGVVAAMALLVVGPYISDNLLLLGRTVLGQPVLPLLGGLLLVVAAVLAPALAAAHPDPALSAGGLAGAGIGLLVVAMPPLVAGVVMAQLHPTWGPWTVVVVALVLVAMAAREAFPRSGGRADPDLPGQTRLQGAAGGLALLAGAAALASAVTPQFVEPPGLPRVDSLDHRLLVPAGVLLVLLGAAMLLPRIARQVRPALSVAWAVVPMAAFAALDVVFTATGIAGVRAGAGAWLAGLAAVAAAAAGGCAGLAGGVERDDVDLSDRSARRPVLAVAVAAVVLAVAGFGLPVLHATDYSPPGLWSGFRFASWGLLLALLAVAVSALLAAYSRPARGVASLLGAAAVLGVHCLELPVTAARAADTGPGAGLPVSLLAILALLVAAALSWRAGARTAKATGGPTRQMVKH